MSLENSGEYPLGYNYNEERSAKKQKHLEGQVEGIFTKGEFEESLKVNGELCFRSFTRLGAWGMGYGRPVAGLLNTDARLLNKIGFRDIGRFNVSNTPAFLAADIIWETLRLRQGEGVSLGNMVVYGLGPDLEEQVGVIIEQLANRGIRPKAVLEYWAGCSGGVEAWWWLQQLRERNTKVAQDGQLDVMVGVGSLSRLIEPGDKNTGYLFGDGVTVNVVDPSRVAIHGDMVCVGDYKDWAGSLTIGSEYYPNGYGRDYSTKPDTSLNYREDRVVVADSLPVSTDECLRMPVAGADRIFNSQTGNKDRVGVYYWAINTVLPDLLEQIELYQDGVGMVDGVVIHPGSLKIYNRIKDQVESGFPQIAMPGVESLASCNYGGATMYEMMARAMMSQTDEFGKKMMEKMQERGEVTIYLAGMGIGLRSVFLPVTIRAY